MHCQGRNDNVLGEIINIGDIVTITIAKDEREQGYNPCPDGALATVLGFAEIAHGHTSNYNHKPGIYENRCWIKLRLADGREHTELHSCVKLFDTDEEKERVTAFRARQQADTLDPDAGFLRDLPETPFWEGDFVMVTGFNPGISSKRADGAYQITRIEYGSLESKCDDGSPYPWIAYTFSSSFSAGWSMAASVDDLTLVERGPVWKHYHNEPIEFTTFKEEAEFYKLLGHTNEVRNPANGLYCWTLDEVLGAIRDGLVHGISMDQGLFGFATHKDDRIRAIRFRNEDLGARVAKTTLEGFTNKDEV